MLAFDEEKNRETGNRRIRELARRRIRYFGSGRELVERILFQSFPYARRVWRPLGPETIMNVFNKLECASEIHK